MLDRVGARVLVADDEPGLRRALERGLRAEGMQVVTVAVATVVTVAGLVLFLLLARASTAVVAHTLTQALDTELAAAVSAAAPAVTAGRSAPQLPRPGPGPEIQVRVLDRAGTPVDGEDPAPLSARDVRQLLAGAHRSGARGGGGARCPGDGCGWLGGSLVALQELPTLPGSAANRYQLLGER